jgi:hypothetical protein
LHLKQVTRSIWRGRIGEPKTEASCASVSVSQSWRFSSMHTARCTPEETRQPDADVIFPNGMDKLLDLDYLCAREMKPLFLTWICSISCISRGMSPC